MKYLLVAWISCQSLDTITTWNLLHPSVGGRDINPIVGRSRAKLVTVKASVNLGAFIWHQRAAKDSKIMPIALAAHGCAASAWNLSQR